MAQLTDVERKWIVDLTGDGAAKPGEIEEQEQKTEETAALKRKLIDQMTEALDLVRDEMAEGERYELIIKGRFRDKKVQSVQKAKKTFEEVETMEDIKKAEVLSAAQQKKIFEAHKKAIEVKDIMANAKTKVKGKDGKETEVPLFTDEEITEEFWTPVMRERLLPDNAIPARHSVVQQTFQASAQLYHDKLDEMEAESGSHEELAKKLGLTTQAIAAAGELAGAIETLTGAPEIASKIRKGIQIGLMAGTGIAKGALEKSGDGIVDNITKLINVTVGGATGNNELGMLVANAFKASAKGAVIAKHLSRGKAGTPEALASLGDAIDSAMTTADTDSTKGSWAMTGKLIAGALKAQKGITPVIVKAIGDGKKPDMHALIRGFTKATASAFGTYMEVKRDFDNAAIKQEAEEVKKKAEEAKHEAELGKNEAQVAKAEEAKKHEEAQLATAESEAAAREAEKAREEAEHARKEAEIASKAAEEAVAKVDHAQGKDAAEASEKAVEATAKAAEAAARASEASAKAAEASAKSSEFDAKKDEAESAVKEAREEAEKAEEEAKAKEEEAAKAEEEAEKKKEEAEKECDENIEKVVVAEELLEWATEEEEEPKGGKRKTAKEKKADFEKELKARGLDMDKLKAASTTPEAINALKAKTEEMEKEANREKLNEKSEEFKALLEDSMKADGEAAEAAQELRSVERIILQMEADKKILETFNMVIDTAGVIADQLIPGLRAITAGKDFILAVIAAAERACQFNMWCDRLSDSQNSLSPYAEPIKNRVHNSKVQMTQKTILAILKAAQVAGAVSACSGIGAAGIAVEKGALLTEKAMDIALKIKTERDMAAQWKLFQEAFDNPDHRRLGKKALQGNPTLSKYALAYGAIVAKDANALAASNKCGLTDEMLAHEDTNVGIVVKFLELKFEDDPKLYKPIPRTPEWAPKGSEIELNLESWISMKQAAIKKGGMKEDQPTAGIDGGFAKLSKAKKDFEAKKKKGTLTDAELALCTAALADLQSALKKFVPLKKKGEPFETMKDYANDLLILVKQQADQFEIDLVLIKSEQAEKSRLARPADVGAVKPSSAQQAPSSAKASS